MIQTKRALVITGIIVVVVAATMTIRVESVSAASTGSPESAKFFAPGHNNPPPGQIADPHGPGGASKCAPGKEKSSIQCA